jgi:hypothetical protein
MRRREFIRLLGGATAVWPLAARAQQPDRMRLIGVLMGYAESDPAAQSWIAAFRDTLAKLGWTEGSKLRIELRLPGIQLRIPTARDATIAMVVSEIADSAIMSNLALVVSGNVSAGENAVALVNAKKR